MNNIFETLIVNKYIFLLGDNSVVCVYMHTYLHIYIDTYIHTYIYIYTYLYIYIYTFICMNIYIYTCKYIYNIYTFICINTYIYTCKYIYNIYTFICINIYIYICIYTYIYIHIYIHKYKYKYIYIHMHIYIYTYSHAYVYIYIHAYIYIYCHGTNKVHACSLDGLWWCFPDHLYPWKFQWLILPLAELYISTTLVGKSRLLTFRSFWEFINSPNYGSHAAWHLWPWLTWLFPKSWSYPKLAGWFMSWIIRLQWMMTRGTPMTQEAPTVMIPTWFINSPSPLEGCSDDNPFAWRRIGAEDHGQCNRHVPGMVERKTCRFCSIPSHYIIPLCPYIHHCSIIINTIPFQKKTKMAFTSPLSYPPFSNLNPTELMLEYNGYYHGYYHGYYNGCIYIYIHR